MDEEVRFVQLHRRIGLHADVVDAPALSSRVAGPDEADGAPVKRCGAEPADDRLGDAVAVVEIGRGEAVEDVLIGQQIVEHAFDRKIAAGQCVNRRQPNRRRKTLGRRIFDRNARRAVGPRPDHAGLGIDITRLDAMREGRPAEVSRVEGSGKNRCGRKSRGTRGKKKGAAGQCILGSGQICLRYRLGNHVNPEADLWRSGCQLLYSWMKLFRRFGDSSVTAARQASEPESSSMIASPFFLSIASGLGILPRKAM